MDKPSSRQKKPLEIRRFRMQPTGRERYVRSNDTRHRSPISVKINGGKIDRLKGSWINEVNNAPTNPRQCVKRIFAGRSLGEQQPTPTVRVPHNANETRKLVARSKGIVIERSRRPIGSISFRSKPRTAIASKFGPSGLKLV